MIYFCIPCHNEERTAGIVLWKIRQVMAEFPRDYQILVADDASTDRSYEILEPYSRVLPLTLLRTNQRRGYAATLEMLLREAVRRSDYPKRDIVVVLQADFTDDPEYAVDLLKRLESGADIAVAEPASSEPAGFVRGIADRFARRLASRRSWPPEIKDPFHGFVAIRLVCLQKAIGAATGRLLAWEGRAANAAMLHAALPHARRTDTVEITSHPKRLQRDSRFDVLGAVLNAWHFGNGKPNGGLLDAASLSPDQIHGDRAALRASAGNGKRAESNDPDQGSRSRNRDRNGPRRAESGQRPRRDRDGQTSSGDRSDRGLAGQTDPTDSPRPERAGTGDPGTKPRRARGQAGTGDRPRRDRSSRTGSGDRPRRDRRPHHDAAASSQEDGPPPNQNGDQTTEAAEAGPGNDAISGAGAPARKSRGRRSGRRRGDRPRSDKEPGTPPQGSEPEEVTASVAGPDEDLRDSVEAAADPGEAGPRKRRRRGRRGGRRHRGSRAPSAGTEGAPEAGSGTGSDADPATAGRPVGP